MDLLLNDNADIKKRLKNIELLTEINNDPDFSKDVINRVTKNIFKANIFPSMKDLVDETEYVIRKNFPDISESMDSRHHSNLFKRIKAKSNWQFLKSLGNPNSLALISNPPRRRLIHGNQIKESDMLTASSLTFFLKTAHTCRPEEGELDAEETSEEESEEEEEEGKSLKRRKTLRGHVPSSSRAPFTGRVSPPLTSPSRLLPEYFDTEGEGRQRAREVLQRLPEGRRESCQQHSQEGWREGRQRSGEEEGDTTGGNTERAEIVAE
ncbi:hypothetical protein Glove_208g229 [Diversispora epigaea]|uniref:Uncharacterized protein n=1 Tax=Diversispora epigaea TaxID=1348612 RepID=A0A397IM02_9GLOM|nr:hypothetical protein Glove_208g229 [Diversispora epigaea]